MNKIEDMVAQAIGDPGSIVPRAGDDETVTRWATRAVLEVLEVGIIGLGNSAELPDNPAMRALVQNAVLRDRLRVADGLLPIGWRGPDEGDIKLPPPPPPPPAEAVPSDLRDMARAVGFAAYLLQTELGPGGLMERESGALRANWALAIDCLESAATVPMLPLFQWRERKAKEAPAPRRAGIATLTRAERSDCLSCAGLDGTHVVRDCEGAR